MNLTIQMHDPQGKIMEELTDPLYRGTTQGSVALTYAFVIAQLGGLADWRKINAAIRARWKSSTALPRIKKLAWKQVDEWGRVKR